MPTMTDELVAIRVSLTHVPTGKTVEFDDDGYSCPEFSWTEGNNSCDCNRALYFHRVDNPDYNEDHDCGDVEYRLNWIRNRATGELICEGDIEPR